MGFDTWTTLTLANNKHRVKTPHHDESADRHEARADCVGELAGDRAAQQRADSRATIPFALADAGTSNWWLMTVLLVRGFGMGAVMIPVMSVAYVGLDRPEVADASIITRLAQQTGGAFGTALLAVILESATDGTQTADLAHGFHIAFWWAVGFTALAIGVCRFLPSPPARKAAQSHAAGTATAVRVTGRH